MKLYLHGEVGDMLHPTLKLHDHKPRVIPASPATNVGGPVAAMENPLKSSFSKLCYESMTFNLAEILFRVKILDSGT